VSIHFPEGRLGINHSEFRQTDGFGFQRCAPIGTAFRRGGKAAADLPG
jgi:hypothetical protein